MPRKYPVHLKTRITKTLLNQLRTRKVTNAQAAEKMGVSETYLSRTVAAMQDKERGTSMIAREQASQIAAQRREHRERLAKKVKNGELGLATAAQRANCSERTMSRYVAKYIESTRRPRKAGRRASA